MGGVLSVILETRRKVGKNPSPGGADDIMGAFLIFDGRKDTVRKVCNVDSSGSACNKENCAG